MPRIARVVVPGVPHHVIQRGNRRQKVFFSEHDRLAYLNLLRICAKPCGLKFWAYCLMDNHVHFIVVPEREDSLARGFSKVHQRYTRRINFRKKWRGYLWEGRFRSYPLSEPHLYAAIRYVENNPVRAKMVQFAQEYPWSSAKAHVYGDKDLILDASSLDDRLGVWNVYLSNSDEAEHNKLLRRHISTGRPLGDNSFIEGVEKITGRFLRKLKPGPKKK